MTDDDAAPILGRRLEGPEWRKALADLQQWMSPADMAAQFDALSAITGDLLFEHGENGFIRDAYIAAGFASARGASRVRLADDPPDFEIELDGVTHKFEATEADIPGRRRGKEYKDARGKPPEARLVGQDVINAGIAAVPVALRAAAEGKVAKARKNPAYDPSWGLVILQNCATSGCGHDAVEASFDHATEPASAAFAEVWVLWGGDAYRTWPPGGPRPAKRPIEPPDFDLSEIFPGR